jgi:DNA-binding NarL/FixJ family response regulator
VTTSVFLIEDMHPVRSALLELLGPAQYKVVGTASTEAEANLWLQENRGAWQLTIVDLILEQGTGLRVIAKARETSASGHIVVFSSFATPGIVAHCLRLGANAVFDKSEGADKLVAYCAALKLPGSSAGGDR